MLDTIAFIGGGVMAEAMIAGLLRIARIVSRASLLSSSF